jgi:bifunctional non-homologous end joining protein LigD
VLRRSTGGKGLHVVAPLDRRNTWEQLKGFAHALAVDLERRQPKLYVSSASKSRRQGRIFVDYLRNSRGATAVAAYTVRARPGAPVSTPLAWSELDERLRGDTYTVANLRRRLKAQRRDPWSEFGRIRQSLGARALRAVGASSA